MTHELQTFLCLYDRCIRGGNMSDDEFQELTELAREIWMTQTISAKELLPEMLGRMTHGFADADRREDWE